MTQISNVNTTTTSTSTSSSINQLELDDFLDLMIAELQNQDPLNPLENDELLAQISQIREIGASEQLTETLDAVLLGQNITSATNLIGADVVALNEAGQRISGNVQVVTIVDGEPQLSLAIDPSASVAESEGSVEQGNYVYEIVWESTDGDLFGFEIGASTSSVDDFPGAVQLSNLPQTTGRKTIYRTDSSGEGDRLEVGSVSSTATTFVDTVSDNQRTGDPLTAQVQLVEFSGQETVSLSNVGEIRPPAL